MVTLVGRSLRDESTVTAQAHHQVYLGKHRSQVELRGIHCPKLVPGAH
jgi:hypothetical protein